MENQAAWGRFKKILGSGIESSYKKSLIKSGACDTLIGIIGQKIEKINTYYRSCGFYRI